MGVTVSQMIGNWIICWTAYSGYQQRKYESFELLFNCEGNSTATDGFSHEGPVTLIRKHQTNMTDLPFHAFCRRCNIEKLWRAYILPLWKKCLYNSIRQNHVDRGASAAYFMVSPSIHWQWSYNFLFHRHSYCCRDFTPLRPRQNGRHFQDNISNAFSWMKIYGFRLKFQWTLFLKFQLTILQHWFR